jgi:hypothetical protein
MKGFTMTTNSKDAEKLLRLTGDVEKDGSLAQALMEVTGYNSVTPLARLISPTDLDAWVSRIRCALMCRHVAGKQTTLPDMTKKILDPNYRGPGKRNIVWDDPGTTAGAL